MKKRLSVILSCQPKNKKQSQFDGASRHPTKQNSGGK
jgi:hypothetical protein